MPRIHDLVERVSRALKPSTKEDVVHLPTQADLESLLHRLEREWTVARGSCVWKSTWAELLDLCVALRADKGDLADLYGLDDAKEMIRERLPEVEEGRFFELLRRQPIHTLESLAALFVSTARSNPDASCRPFGQLVRLITAYAPDKDDLEVLDLVIEVVRRAGADELPEEDHDGLRRRRILLERRRVERYERQRAKERDEENSVQGIQPL